MSTAASRTGFVNKLRAHLELLDPVTWISVFPCLAGGVMASGAMQASVQDYLFLLLLFLMYGPLGTGFSQTINDYYDLELDRINEPTRPIPSGRLTEKEALLNSIVVCLLALGTGIFLALSVGGTRGMIIISSIIAGLVVAYIYSAPPLKLKKNILTSAPAVGFSYSFITFLSANAVFSEIRPEAIWLAVLNFFMAIALIIMNDFKSAKGDEESGLKSLTVMIGAKNTFLVAFAIIDIVFALFAWLTFSWGFTVLMYVILVSLIANIVIQVKLYKDPQQGLSFMQHAVDDGFGNAIGKSDVQEHNAFLRYQVANNLLFLVNLLVAAGMVGVRYM
ncbi:UbiA family prenyltransferase [Prosthecochloris sp. N3]|uniref:UbiA family prenyltransferase n=1 Tax=Prosthecochloris ethylica TaxID=2743976 RepID=A0ABR9XNV7_9CHLB|nr:(bacterio)chlorophyll synthase [Prosthecochloris ethylica]MBF0585805.1 UbiA family prenyltransferase [Prosthecochloris ethylica]MBF0635715.1 UbiA family prenyltransferase [Prosthecochloris ethylica]NUK47013.1 UbiA family prenyltransferase [Prosthecochloris ethylica]